MPSDTTERTQPFRVCDEVTLPSGPEVIRANARRDDSYPIHVTRGLEESVELLPEVAAEAKLAIEKLAILTDETVDALHGRALRETLADAGIPAEFYVLPPGERSKSTKRALELWGWLAAGDMGRRDLIVTFGGGVINDLGGWVASAFMRGLPYINLPTTLLAQVDGAMGGKVAVNHPTAKNLLGAFYQPTGVISDVALLATLDRRHVAAGLAEAIKKAVIASPAYWEFITENAEALLSKDLDALERLVRCAAAIKTLLVERDPYEDDLRRPLNFGHTVGHPLETISGYGPLLHGEAVAFGMVVEARIAVNRGLFSEQDLSRLLTLLDLLGLPWTKEMLPFDVDLESLIAAMEPVSRIRDRNLLYPLPKRMGEVVIADDVTGSELATALHECGV